MSYFPQTPFELGAVSALVDISHGTKPEEDALFHTVFTEEGAKYIGDRHPATLEQLKDQTRWLHPSFKEYIEGVYAVSTENTIAVVFIPKSRSGDAAFTANTYYRRILPWTDYKNVSYCSVIRVSRTGPVMAYYPPGQNEEHGWSVLDATQAPNTYGLVTTVYNLYTDGFTRFISPNIYTRTL